MAWGVGDKGIVPRLRNNNDLYSILANFNKQPSKLDTHKAAAELRNCNSSDDRGAKVNYLCKPMRIALNSTFNIK
jgi:hypothetical protein